MSPGARGASLPPSYASGMSGVPLLGKNIGDSFHRTVAADPAREALVEVSTGQRWTLAPLRANVDALALGVLGAGVQKDDRAGIWAPNMAEWTLPQYTTASTGASLVTINSSRRPGSTRSRAMCSWSRTS
jgi:fatty-acyl-CoA synthase